VALSLLLFGAGLVATALASRPEPVSVAAGATYFHHRDLGAPYATGVPFALALAALDRYPEELGRNRDEFCAKFGVLVDPDRGRRLPVGFVLRRDRWTGTDFLMTNCALCHTGVIGGRKIDGLGNRNLRLNAMNHAILRIAGRADFNAGTMLPAAEAAARRRQLPWDWRSRRVAGIAIRELKEMAQRERTPGQRGMSRVDAGPGRNTPIEFAKTISHVAIQPPYGYAKIPAVWMYAKRRTFGWDGALTGDKGLMLASVEFNKGMPPKEILRHPERWQSLNAYLNALRPPAYPRPIDPKLATRGRALFAANCSGCHGTYGPGVTGGYKERVVPVSVVGTDPDRLRAVSPALVAARRQNPFGERVLLTESEGYVPPPLDGIWCRGPYLHNASVPTLEDMLRPPAERPVRFYVGGDTDYDLDRLGIAFTEEQGTRRDDPATGRRGVKTGSASSPRRPVAPGAQRRVAPSQIVFDTRAPGNSNQGHPFGTHLSATERRALLEYLKQL
jgi:mono/diheme cytochrome c family protein